MAFAHSSDTGRPTLLIVDDDSYFRRLLKKILDDAGYDVFEVPTSQQALHFLKKRPSSFAGAIVDLGLPGLTGHELIRTIRSASATAQLPIVVCTASDDKTDIHEVATLNVQGYAVKPVFKKTFIPLVQDALSRKVKCA